jgi:hypothetical protein
MYDALLARLDLLSQGQHNQAGNLGAMNTSPIPHFEVPFTGRFLTFTHLTINYIMDILGVHTEVVEYAKAEVYFICLCSGWPCLCFHG